MLNDTLKFRLPLVAAGLLLVAGTQASAQVVDTLVLKPASVREEQDARRQKERLESVKIRGGNQALAKSPGLIGANPRLNAEIPEYCVDAKALATQIMSGGPVNSMRNTTLGSLDASRGLVPTALATHHEHVEVDLGMGALQRASKPRSAFDDASLGMNRTMRC